MYSNRFILSSRCPYSRSIVTCAGRIGGILDPEFLNHCEITDNNLRKSIEQLKNIPWKYQSNIINEIIPEEMFLDIDILNNQQFIHSNQFQQYNSWLNHQWNYFENFQQDLII